MLITAAEYIGSFTDYEKCPKGKIPEFAFIGRSNVGKSSLINYLTGRKKLSKVSVTPGKTQTLNYFLVNGNFHFVDLPGYGYAKISKQQRDKWNNMIRNYLLKREQLMYVFLLIDSRIPPQKNDLDFINWLGRSRIPSAFVFTKADKPGAKEIVTNLQQFKKKLLESWEELPPHFTTSAEKKIGADELLMFMENGINQFR